MWASLVVVLLWGLGVAVRAADRAREHGAAALLHAQSSGQVPLELTTYVSTYTIVSTLNHCDSTATGSCFTQGLTFDSRGRLYESDGIEERSRVRRLDTETGATLESVVLENTEDFGEGLQAMPDDTLIQLVWKSRRAYRYRTQPALTYEATLDNDVGKEGWGLTRSEDGQTLYMTDSTEELIHIDPSTMTELDRVPIYDHKLESNITGVNELETVPTADGTVVLGNVLPLYWGKASECIAVIEPQSGHVQGWIVMKGLRDKEPAESRLSIGSHVLNGIAYDSQNGTLYVTGKDWVNMYVVKPVPAPELGADYIRDECDLKLNVKTE